MLDIVAGEFLLGSPRFRGSPNVSLPIDILCDSRVCDRLHLRSLLPALRIDLLKGFLRSAFLLAHHAVDKVALLSGELLDREHRHAVAQVL